MSGSSSAPPTGISIELYTCVVDVTVETLAGGIPISLHLCGSLLPQATAPFPITH